MVADGQDEERPTLQSGVRRRILVTPDGRIGTMPFRIPETLFLLALTPVLFITHRFLRSGQASAASPVSGISLELIPVT